MSLPALGVCTWAEHPDTVFCVLPFMPQLTVFYVINPASLRMFILADSNGLPVPVSTGHSDLKGFEAGL